MLTMNFVHTLLPKDPMSESTNAVFNRLATLIVVVAMICGPMG